MLHVVGFALVGLVVIGIWLKRPNDIASDDRVNAGDPGPFDLADPRDRQRPLEPVRILSVVDSSTANHVLKFSELSSLPCGLRIHDRACFVLRFLCCYIRPFQLKKKGEPVPDGRRPELRARAEK